MTIADELTTGARDAVDRVKIDVTSTEARVSGYVTDKPIERAADWAPVFRRFNLDPDAFEVVDDTVRMSSWDQSKRTEDGHRDVAVMYAYSARFRRITAEQIAPAVVDTWRNALIVRDRVKPATPAPAAGTYVILIADPQLGKKGTAEAVQNWRDAVTRHLDTARQLGDAVGAVHLAWMGDEHENVMGNYRNQPHTVELNRSAQLELDYDMRVWTVREALELGVPVTGSSVISNHGEWTREGDTKDPMTTRNDNSSTHVARQVAKLFDELAPFTGRNVAWTIGEKAPGITATLSGVPCYFSHGYVEKGRGASTEVRTRNAIERQILGRTDELGDTALWFMAHYHHHYSNEFEGRTLFGCPALEAERSSEYMLDQYGVWSPPGALGMVVSRHASRGWAHLNVF